MIRIIIECPFCESSVVGYVIETERIVASLLGILAWESLFNLPKNMENSMETAFNGNFPMSCDAFCR